MPYVEVKNTIRLTDTDGIIFDLDINMIAGVLVINGNDSCTEISIISGSKIIVKEPAMDVMQKIVNAKFSGK